MWLADLATVSKTESIQSFSAYSCYGVKLIHATYLQKTSQLFVF